ncbi:PIN domain-containing protein [Patescibacteria group bacterium]|nr:PIN domain-containing protein [Patescibacteria group bacterium]MBU4481217.1 PIN domain-containing protein [Patescibacteria group bacterium]
MYYIADTHAFLWYLSDSPKLSQKARAIFDSCDRGETTIIISAIVLLESIDILDKKKIRLNFDEIIFKILQANNFIFSEINWSLILELNKIKGLKDLHDRVLVTTAQLFNTFLISKDKIIKDFYKKTIW